MTRQSSFSKLRNEMMRDFRERMHQAESTEDVKKFYTVTMCRFFERLMGEDGSIRPDYVTLDPDSSSGYLLTRELTDHPGFQSVWNDSDLPTIVNEFTKVALNRHVHLGKNPEKTRAKIHHADGKR